MSAPSYGRVLGGVLAGLAGALGLTRFLGIPWDRTWEVYGLFPLGAVLGARWAVGRGGTARWAALLGGWGMWMLTTLVLSRLNVLGGKEQAMLFLPDMGILAGAWSAMLRRSFSKLGGAAAKPAWAALACVGLLTWRIMWMGLGMVQDALATARLLPDLSSIEDLFTYFAIENAVALVCGLGALASFAEDLSLPWAGAALAAGGVSLLVSGATYVVASAGLENTDWLLVPWLLPATAWFAWWGSRIAREQG